jgi:hypothetical protein
MAYHLSFDDNGFLLPYKLVETDLETFEAVFSFNKHRQTLFEAYKDYLAELQSIIGSNFFQYINGSFVSLKEQPYDIDFVNFIDFEVFKIKQSRIEALNNRYINKGLDCKTFGVYPDKHKLAPLNDYLHYDYQELYGTTHPKKYGKVLPKGFIKLTF